MAAQVSESLANAARDLRKRQVWAAQTALLYSNAYTGVAVTVIAAPLVAYFQWAVIPHSVVSGWLLYMLLVSGGRFLLARRYWRASPNSSEIGRWSAAFAAGAGLAGAGWGAAGIVLYPEGQLMHQVILVFVIGGMMLGGASLLAPRSEAFIAFLIPTGLLPAMRLLAEADEVHLGMGVMATVYTLAMVATTWRIHLSIESSLNLRCENQDLVTDLQIAKDHTEALNQQLEVRVEERTAALHESNERLRAEITQRESMEEELLRVRKLESLGVLAGGIAHDFNNLVTVIQGNIELAGMRLERDAPVRVILEQAAAACQRAVSLSSQLLTFAKGGSPIRRVTSVAKLVEGAVQLARAGAVVTIAADVAEDLWCAEVDAGQMGQVFHNILLNAKQSMPDGGTIDVRAQNVDGAATPGPGAYVRISIRDHGTGMAADVLPRIFDPYFTTKQSRGGLGLATAYAIVSKHLGRLSVESTAGEGSVFFVDLPASPSSPTPEPPAGAPLRTGTGRLLAMDDEETLRRLLSQVLGRLGYEVASARDGAEAIALYQAAKTAGKGFDAVLLDLTVPGGMGGVETAAKLKALDPMAKLIASSGYADAPVMANFRDYGFDDAISKPWAVLNLSEAIRRVLAADRNKAE